MTNLDIENQFIQILNEELIKASGCTEPIALAFAGAKCRDVLGKMPTKITISASGNIIKNVQGVIIPGTKDLKGVETAVVLGAIGGDYEEQLLVLKSITAENIDSTKEFISEKRCKLSLLKTEAKLHFVIEMEADGATASVEIMHTHTNIVSIKRSGENIIYNPCSVDNFNSSLTTREDLSVQRVFDFAKRVDISRVQEVLDMQLDCNIKIAEEGLKGKYGLRVGNTLLQDNPELDKELLKAWGASGSDARMSGCDLPVVINSGSGNQGLTIAAPVYIYATRNNYSKEELYRAMIVANLIPIHIKTKIGRLSAFCGAVTAGLGVGAALSFITGGDVNEVCGTIKNGIASLSGVICDGAKPSCALKIASSIDSAYMAFRLSKRGNVVEKGTGIISECVEQTIGNVTNIASNGMDQTDDLILDIMTK